MGVYLEIVDGRAAGARFAVADGTTLGRSAADIVIDDAKVSVKHAFVESRRDGLYLVDSGSSNGIKLGKQRVPEILLVDGICVQLGSTQLRVVETHDAQPAEGEAKADAQAPQAVAPTAEWIPTVQGLLRRALETATDEAAPVGAFEPPLLLRCIQGRQTGTEWTVGFGPRQAGAGSTDLPIEEPNAPAVCFELMPARAGAIFSTRHANKVRLNGREVASAPIGDGDLIDIENTRIQIRAIKNASKR
jgi:pSer/pThr/pTyr-binding forkhead associated (FHA) protein